MQPGEPLAPPVVGPDLVHSGRVVRVEPLDRDDGRRVVRRHLPAAHRPPVRERPRQVPRAGLGHRLDRLRHRRDVQNGLCGRGIDARDQGKAGKRNGQAHDDPHSMRPNRDGSARIASRLDQEKQRAAAARHGSHSCRRCSRGASLTGDRRREMKAIVSLVAAGNLAGIAQEITAMKRLWSKSQFPGLHKRRDDEAELVRTARSTYTPDELIKV